MHQSRRLRLLLISSMDLAIFSRRLMVESLATSKNSQSMFRVWLQKSNGFLSEQRRSIFREHPGTMGGDGFKVSRKRETTFTSHQPIRRVDDRRQPHLGTMSHPRPLEWPIPRFQSLSRFSCLAWTFIRRSRKDIAE